MRLFRQSRDNLPHSGALRPVAGVIQKNPALAGGATAIMVVTSLITINAVWYQSVKHPSPLFSTRSAFLDVEDTSGKSSDRRLASRISNFQVSSPVAVQPDELTREIQGVLADKEIYQGKIDGLYGSKTRAAIVAYQKNAGLNASGEVSARLLSHILLSTSAETAVLTTPMPIENGVSKVPRPSSAQKLVSTIQAGLRNYGYDDVIIDGVMGQQTSNAIKRFELDYGLRITGEASAKLLEKLKAVGAVEQG